jgi:hypothetical protein
MHQRAAEGKGHTNKRGINGERDEVTATTAMVKKTSLGLRKPRALLYYQPAQDHLLQWPTPILAHVANAAIEWDGLHERCMPIRPMLSGKGRILARGGRVERFT